MSLLLAMCALASGASELIRWDLEASGDGLQPVDPEQQWEWGSFPSGYGPGGGLTGGAGWATLLEQAYFNEVESALGLPSFDLTGAREPMLELVLWHAVDASDEAVLVTDLGGGGVAIEPVYGYPGAGGFTGRSDGWITAWFDLSGVDNTDELYLLLRSDASVQMAGWYIDELSVWDGDVAPPRLSDLEQLSDTEDLDGPYRVSVTADDNDGAPGVTLFYRVGGGGEQAVVMQPVGADRFDGLIEGGAPPDTLITYQARANDGVTPVFLPEGEPLSFRVRLPPPLELTGPEGRVVDTSAQLSWTPPDSEHPVLGYQIYRGEEALQRAEVAFARVALVGGGDDTFTVTALYDIGEAEAAEGDPSAPLTLEVALPEVLEITPREAYQGDQVRLQVTGSYLLLAEGQVSAALGEGVEVVGIDVLSVDQVSVFLEVAEDAPMGSRDLQLEAGGVSVRVEAAFEVLDGQGRPVLLSVQPDALRQGDADRVVITASTAFAELPLVDLGEGVLVEEIIWLSDASVEVQVVVEPTAALGVRRVIVDDGLRLVEGVGFRVRDALPTPTGRCQSGGVGGAGAWVLLGLLGLLGIRRSAPR